MSSMDINGNAIILPLCKLWVLSPYKYYFSCYSYVTIPFCRLLTPAVRAQDRLPSMPPRAGNPDWDKLFAEYTATQDVPAALFTEELSKKYPDAKVILTVRDPEMWYHSVHETVFQISQVDADACDRC